MIIHFLMTKNERKMIGRDHEFMRAVIDIDYLFGLDLPSEGEEY